MSEFAYSLKLKETISAIKAHKLSISGDLPNKHDFICQDTNCGIALTCTNWQDPNGRRIYFRPTSNSELHRETCNEIECQKEDKEINGEKNLAKLCVKKNEYITMCKSIKLTAVDATFGTLQCYSDENTKRNISLNNKSGGISTESRNFSCIRTFIDMFKDTSVDKNLRLIRSGEKLLCFNELFFFMDSEADIIIDGMIHIFHGLFRISPSKYNEEEVVFFSKNKESIYITLNTTLLRGHNKNIIDNCLGKDVYGYFRGCYAGGRKIKFYNQDKLRDIWLEESTL